VTDLKTEPLVEQITPLVPTITDVDLSVLVLPDPEPREVKATLISVDDHVLEAPDTFEGRLPKRLQDRAPRVVEAPHGHQAWEFDGRLCYEFGESTTSGRDKTMTAKVPFRYEYLRPGYYDVDARVRDMDINGTWASLNFPSFVSGFCGRVFSKCSDPELGLAVTKAWNDWIYEEWYLPHPDRIIPLGITFLTDPVAGAAEIRRNAERGFRSVTLPERPQNIGLPSLFTDHWDPIIEACVETDTVISLHVGSTGVYEAPAEATIAERDVMISVLFAETSLSAAVEWLVSGYPVRYPDLKIAMSEGGIGWVAMVLDRLENMVYRSGYASGLAWIERPADVLRRNFWFCTIDDPSTIDTRHTIGLDHIMVEVDYPHADSTWPDTQAVIEQCWGHLPPAELRKICCENAASLYRHRLPDNVLPSL
jgi:predicted TIM-barrel fold metal-dependent hydrolase